MYLAADPTLVYAHNDFSIKRVLNIHKKINSPYNTYRNKGLPPGPINMPEKKFIDAVLNYNNHNYYFFCAKDDFSGYHVFATNLKEHNRNAKKFHRALNKRKNLSLMLEDNINIRVRYADTDQMGFFVYYGNYAKYYEIARVELFRNIGLTYKSLEKWELECL